MTGNLQPELPAAGVTFLILWHSHSTVLQLIFQVKIVAVAGAAFLTPMPEKHLPLSAAISTFYRGPTTAKAVGFIFPHSSHPWGINTQALSLQQGQCNKLTTRLH